MPGEDLMDVKSACSGTGGEEKSGSVDTKGEPIVDGNEDASRNGKEGCDGGQQRAEKEEKRSTNFISRLGSFLGTDVMASHIHVPMWVMEPSTQLMRMAETFEFSELLDAAVKTQNAVSRHAHVVAFVVSAFAHTTRTGKPFVPVKGETFEYRNDEKSLTFYAEQLSDRPSVSASVVQGRGWKFGETVDVSAHFHGNAIEVKSRGSRFLILENPHNSNAEPDVLSWNLPTALAGNLVVGGAFVDQFGAVVLTNHTTGHVARLEFRRMGWLNAGKGEVSGLLFDSVGTPLMRFGGKWFEALDGTPLGANGEPCAPTERLWTVPQGFKVDGDAWNMTRFAYELLGLDPVSRKPCGKVRLAVERAVEKRRVSAERSADSSATTATQTGKDEEDVEKNAVLDEHEGDEVDGDGLPPLSDCRFRRDVIQLAMRDSNGAARSRNELEDKHRARIEREKKKDEHESKFEPRYFESSTVDCEVALDLLGKIGKSNCAALPDAMKKVMQSKAEFRASDSGAGGSGNAEQAAAEAAAKTDAMDDATAAALAPRSVGARLLSLSLATEFVPHVDYWQATRAMDEQQRAEVDLF